MAPLRRRFSRVFVLFCLTAWWLWGCERSLQGARCPCATGWECCDGVCQVEGTCSADAASDAWSGSRLDAAAPTPDGGNTAPDGASPTPLPEGASPSMVDFVPLHDVHEMLHDAKRKLLYVTGRVAEHDPWRIHRYDMQARRLLEPFEVQGEFWGLAMSPDQKHLAVADASGEGAARCLLIDLDQGAGASAVKPVSFELEAGEGRPFMPVFVDDSRFVISTARAVIDPRAPAVDLLTVPLRQVQVASLLVERLLDDAGAAIEVSPGTALARSTDGAYLVLAQTDARLGRLARYEIATGKLERFFTNFNLADVTVNHDASRIAVPSYDGLTIQDASGTLRAVPQPWSFETVRGAVFSPRGDLLYLTPGAATWAIEAFHTGSWQTVHVLESDTTQLDHWTDARTFDVGRLRISEDGTLLFAHVAKGVGVYSVGGESEQPDDTVDFPPPEDPLDDPVYDVPEGASFSKVVPIVDGRDVVHDAKRNVLYASTRMGGLYGSVMRWSMDGASEPEPLELDGTFSALDLSPNQDLLAIVDENAFVGHLRLQLVDLVSQEARALDVPWQAFDGTELAAHDVVFLDDDTLLVSASALDGSHAPVPLRRVTISTGMVDVIREITPEAVFARSADGSQVAISWVSYEARTVDHYYPGRAPEQAYQVGTAEVRPYGVALSRDGSQAAVPARSGVLLFDAAGTLVHTLEPVENPDEELYEVRPFSAVYSPVGNRIYVAFGAYAAPDDTPPSITVYDTVSFEQHAVIEAQKDLYWHDKEGPFSNGRMRMSRDGSLLFAISTWGIAVYELGSDGALLP